MKKKILHTESSPGWGGQELRILREAEGMQAEGMRLFLPCKRGGLVKPARASGFLVNEISFKKSHMIQIFVQLLRLISKHRIQIVNTHSSLDGWIGGLAAKICGCLTIRTRHLSTPVRGGLNSRMLYNKLADYVVTTCEEARDVIREQAQLPSNRCLSIPTGVDPPRFIAIPWQNSVRTWALELIRCLAGTLCVLRGWKGVFDLLHAAKLLEEVPHLKWIVVGSGVSESILKINGGN